MKKEILSKYYIITEDGIIIRKADNKILKSCKDNKGYLRARIKCEELSKHKDKRIVVKIHRLVALFYLDNYSEKLQVNHKDGVKTNNNYTNLEMVTNKENVLHAYRVLDSTNRKLKLSNSLKLYHINKNTTQIKIF